MADYNGLISSVLRSLIEGAKKTDLNPYMGDVNYDRASYPMAQIFPDNSTYTGDTEYDDTLTMFIVFEKKNVKDNDARTDEFIDNVEEVEDSLDIIQSELLKNDKVKEAKPEDFEFLISENEDNLLDVIRVDWGVTKFQCFT